MDMYQDVVAECDSHMTFQSVARRYRDAISTSLLLNPAWFLTQDPTQQQPQPPPPARGPSAFLVSRATRSQVTLRRSAPKYHRLAGLHFERQGAEF